MERDCEKINDKQRETSNVAFFYSFVFISSVPADEESLRLLIMQEIPLTLNVRLGMEEDIVPGGNETGVSRSDVKTVAKADLNTSAHSVSDNVPPESLEMTRSRVSSPFTTFQNCFGLLISILGRSIS